MDDLEQHIFYAVVSSDSSEKLHIVGMFEKKEYAKRFAIEYGDEYECKEFIGKWRDEDEG